MWAGALSREVVNGGSSTTLLALPPPPARGVLTALASTPQLAAMSAAPDWRLCGEVDGRAGEKKKKHPPPRGGRGGWVVGWREKAANFAATAHGMPRKLRIIIRGRNMHYSLAHLVRNVGAGRGSRRGVSQSVLLGRDAELLDLHVAHAELADKLCILELVGKMHRWRE